MAVLYVTAAKEAAAEQTIEKSRFIAYIRPVLQRSEAEAFFEEINAKHKDARHCVPAFVIGDKMQLQWASDNGEPQGTAGAPIVQMLVKEGVSNVAVAVVRYFGGILLGTGGLVRAYTSSAKLALDAAGKKEVREFMSQTVDIPYSLYDQLRNDEKNLPFSIDNVKYSDIIKLSLSYEPESENIIKELLKKYKIIA